MVNKAFSEVFLRSGLETVDVFVTGANESSIPSGIMREKMSNR